ncbi:MAG: nucleotidyltransferase domain-containing protein [Lactobacillaceae bacterium]|jgi:predicted nucleotidyltransferase|nr:nucleotidyltransferase domain-containing protein [Lactobacillaceae bacterium]
MTVTNEQITDYLISVAPKQIEAIFQTGSRLNGLAVDDTDYDLMVITRPFVDPNDFVSDRAYSKEARYLPEATGFANELQVKYYDARKLYQLIIKSNPNMLYVLYRKPIYLAKNDETAELFNELFDNLELLSSINKTQFFNALKGQFNRQKNMQFADNPKRYNKALIQSLKFLHYAEDLLVADKLSTIDFADNQEMMDIKQHLTTDYVNLSKGVLVRLQKLSQVDVPAIDPEKEAQILEIFVKYFRKSAGNG